MEENRQETSDVSHNENYLSRDNSANSSTVHWTVLEFERARCLPSLKNEEQSVVRIFRHQKQFVESQ